MGEWAKWRVGDSVWPKSRAVGRKTRRADGVVAAWAVPRRFLSRCRGAAITDLR
jgi:hypothetical protein